MKYAVIKVGDKILGQAQLEDDQLVTVEYREVAQDDPVQVRAHLAVRESCERWRRSLLIDGPRGHLHSHECVQVARLLREKP